MLTLGVGYVGWKQLTIIRHQQVSMDAQTYDDLNLITAFIPELTSPPPHPPPPAPWCGCLTTGPSIVQISHISVECTVGEQRCLATYD